MIIKCVGLPFIGAKQTTYHVRAPLGGEVIACCAPSERIAMSLGFKGTEPGPHLNSRDLGGIRTADGRTIKPGIFFRHGSLYLLTPDEVNDHALRKINTFCDFRGTKEKTLYAYTYPGGAKTVDVGVEKEGLGAKGIEKAKSLMQSGTTDHQTMAMALLPFYVNEIRTFLDTVTDLSNWPMAYGCVAGKDRTGFATALLLHILGVDRTTIFQDYMLTQTLLQPWVDYYTEVMRKGLLAYKMAQTDPTSTLLATFKAAHPIEALTLEHMPPTAEQLNNDASMEELLTHIRGLLGLKRAWLEEAFNCLECDFGGVNEYLANTIGIDDSRIEALRAAALV